MATDPFHQPNDGIKPVIEEIARTEVCFPNIRLIVEDITVVPVPNPNVQSSPGTERAAFRLWLGDGEKMIQGKCVTGLTICFCFAYLRRCFVI